MLPKDVVPGRRYDAGAVVRPDHGILCQIFDCIQCSVLLASRTKLSCLCVCLCLHTVPVYPPKRQTLSGFAIVNDVHQVSRKRLKLFIRNRYLAQFEYKTFSKVATLHGIHHIWQKDWKNQLGIGILHNLNTRLCQKSPSCIILHDQIPVIQSQLLFRL